MASHSDAPAAPIVSFEDEPLIVVDSDDNVLDHRPKTEVHTGDGVLHRAFSIFLFDRAGRLLLQRRSDNKQLWGGYWSNSCCSHPRQGESVAAAAARRLGEELGVRADLVFLYRFEYRARFGEIGSEHELCSVYIGCSDTPVSVNPHEISDIWAIAPAQLDTRLVSQPQRFTPWLHLEWPRIRASHWAEVRSATAAAGDR